MTAHGRQHGLDRPQDEHPVVDGVRSCAAIQVLFVRLKKHAPIDEYTQDTPGRAGSYTRKLVMG